MLNAINELRQIVQGVTNGITEVREVVQNGVAAIRGDMSSFDRKLQARYDCLGDLTPQTLCAC